jgi:transcriptional regulator with XRE-family HTH domain
MRLCVMTTTPERRTATLTELVAQEIDSIRGRKRMSQAQLARAMGKTPMWVSLRLRGLQAIDMNDLALFAQVLEVSPLDLLPAREIAAAASRDANQVSEQVSRLTTPKPATTSARPKHRPTGRTSPGQRRPVGVRSPGHTIPAAYAA